MKKIILPIICILAILAFAACGRSYDAMEDLDVKNEISYSDYDEGFLAGDKNTTIDSNASSGTTEQNKNNEKIIKTVDLTVETKEFDAYLTSLNSNVSKFGGYVESSESNYGKYEYSTRTAHYKVRIPADKLDEFLASTSEKGSIIRKDESQENVTLKYIDIQSRIEAYKVEKETLMNLLSKATSLADTLTIQERLSEVNYQIETYTSQLNVLENRVSYSTVSISISEVERIAEVEPSIWSRIKERFSDNLDNVKEWLENVIVGLIGGIPVFFIIAIIIIPVLIVLKKKKLFKKK